jgi:NADPH2:quinone reductase
MKAMQITAFGDPAVLALRELPTPVARHGEVLVRVHAAGINVIDTKTRRGLGFAASQIGDRLPWTPGYDISGDIEAVGDGVTGFAPGDAVFGMVGFPQTGGGYAEHCVAMATLLCQKPARIDHVAAAAVPLAALTAWQGLFQTGDVAAGHRVLIHAAAGGVGHFAVQFAKARGAYVIGTASATNREFVVQQLGADECIDYRAGAFEEKTGELDFVLDTLGGDIGKRSLAVLRQHGLLVTVPTITAEDVINHATALGRRASGMLVHPDVAMLNTIAGLIQTGRVHPHVETSFPLADAAAAHARLETGHVRGKLVLRMD